MNINSGKPWSQMALYDLRYWLKHGDSVEQVAELLCRDVNEVREKMIETQSRCASARGSEPARAYMGLERKVDWMVSTPTPADQGISEERDHHQVPPPRRAAQLF
jgi:hypothetical protein